MVLSLVAASVLGLPQPDGRYKIPEVGNNRRSQYYVLHEDGSHKYGYDTGDNAFESLKSTSDGEVKGKFGFTDSDGQDYRVQYTSGSAGFVAQGDHIPKVHPDVAAAFSAARAAGPFVDPLAGVDADRSFNFGFDGEEYSRNEVSNSDGTVSGSYSYIDEFGRTRTYNYRAGQGIGFEIEGDDIPQPVEPLPSHIAIAQQRASGSSSSARTRASHASLGNNKASIGASRITGVGHRSSSRLAAHSSSSVSPSRQRNTQTPSQTYFPPAKPSSFSTSSASSGQHSFASHKSSTLKDGIGRKFEAANTRTSFSPSGSYSLAYETSSHSRQEDGDEDNNVKGRFTFTADDDGKDRTVTYEAGSATGFTVEGDHLPIGPSVPGARSGQVTGKIEPVEEKEFVDPLADGNADSSYNFGFDSDTYSRSEAADKDGNVAGSYSVLGEDNILRTYKFRAGHGIGYETEEVSAVPSRSRTTPNTRQLTSNVNRGASSVAGFSSHSRLSQGSSFGSTQFSSPARTSPVVLYKAPVHTAHSSRQGTKSSLTHNARSSIGTSRASHKSRSSSHSSRYNEIFPGFTLNQYDAVEGRGKYGYVLKFDK